MNQNQPNCRVHNQAPAQYFLVEQPWLKFCSACALNMALCGKKIQKNLTSTQFERKISLNTLTKQLKRIIDHYGVGNANLNAFLQQIQKKYTQKVSQQLKNIDHYITTAMKLRDQLFELYEKDIFKKLNNYFQQQSKNILTCLQLKKQLQNIESNFTNLIEIEQQSIFTEKITALNQKLDTAHKYLPNEQQFPKIEKQFQSTILKFNKKISEFQKLSANFTSINHRESIVVIETPSKDFSRVLQEKINKQVVQTEQKRESKHHLKLRSSSKNCAIKTKITQSAMNTRRTARKKSLNSLNSSYVMNK